MLRITRHNLEPFEMTAELIHFLESLPGNVTYVNIHGEVLVRTADQPGREPKMDRSERVRPTAAGRRAAAAGEYHAG